MSLLRTITPFLLALLVALSCVTLNASDAHAKRGIAIINTGEQIFPVGPFPESAQVEDKSLQVATMCSQFGIFWAAVWTSDCRFVAYIPAQDAYADIPPEIMPEVEKTYSLSDGERGLWNRFGLLAIILLVVGFGIFKLRHDDE